ncbi:uncharacterized protein [Spinacia oleracea]|uniref:Reverse transcriptase domain-containing protein n=1 Tax=Spinacia oleracea TaxID=3562 RepID=A0ABM3R2X7_SPIOL|nr:uncharacterized protein LOC130464686 [Spinacia oleracea]
MENRTPVKSVVIDQGPRLSMAHKNSLDCTFQDADIKKMLESIPVTKAPRLYGFNSQFFKSAWPIIKADFYQDIKYFFVTEKLLKEINVTPISLVPKLPVPASVGDFRPIACCSVLYKCIFKLLCAKLKLVLPDIVSPNQGAFVSKRSILHNVLLC